MSFTGFPKNALGFFHELAAEMNKEWFDANKQRYQTEWVEPFTALLEDVSAKLATTYKKEKLGPPKIMRIYRDVRFSKDKTPYKTWIGGGVSLGGASTKPAENVVAVFAHFGVDEHEFVGCGHYVFSPEELVRWRKKVADNKTGPEIAKLVDGLKKKGYGTEAYETLSRVPKPYDADHPRADLLRMKGLVVDFPAIPRGLIHKPAFSAWVAEHCKAAAPVAKWLHTHL